jgi:hypothetical protein
MKNLQKIVLTVLAFLASPAVHAANSGGSIDLRGGTIRQTNSVSNTQTNGLRSANGARIAIFSWQLTYSHNVVGDLYTRVCTEGRRCTPWTNGFDRHNGSTSMFNGMPNTTRFYAEAEVRHHSTMILMPAVFVDNNCSIHLGW